MAKQKLTSAHSKLRAKKPWASAITKRLADRPVIYRGIKIEPPAGKRSAVARAIRDDLLRHPPGQRSRDKSA